MRPAERLLFEVNRDIRAIQAFISAKPELFVAAVGVIVTALAVAAAFWASYEAHQTRVQDERPFLAIDITSAPDNGVPRLGIGHFNLKLVAFGKTPARNVRFRCVIQPNEGTPKKWDEVQADFNEYFKYILPSRSEAVGCKQLDTLAHHTDGETVAVLAYGLAEYEDEEHRKYQTPFCEVSLEAKGTPWAIVQCIKDFGLPELK